MSAVGERGRVMSVRVRMQQVMAAAVASCVVLQAIAVSRGMFWLKVATRPLVMLLLAGVVLAEAARMADGVPRALVAGLVFAAAGDTALAFDSTAAFLVGLLFFAGTHACYLAGHRAIRGADRDISLALVTASGSAWVALVRVLWRRLGVVRLPVALYGLLLFAMTVSAASVRPDMFAGAVSFLLSDLAIGLRVAGIRFPGQQAAIGVLYLLGQFVITWSWLQAAAGRPRLRDRLTGWAGRHAGLMLPVARSWVGAVWG